MNRSPHFIIIITSVETEKVQNVSRWCATSAKKHKQSAHVLNGEKSCRKRERREGIRMEEARAPFEEPLNEDCLSSLSPGFGWNSKCRCLIGLQRSARRRQHRKREKLRSEHGETESHKGSYILTTDGKLPGFVEARNNPKQYITFCCAC